jgi:hypothetical protein
MFLASLNSSYLRFAAPEQHSRHCGRPQHSSSSMLGLYHHRLYLFDRTSRSRSQYGQLSFVRGDKIKEEHPGVNKMVRRIATAAAASHKPILDGPLRIQNMFVSSAFKWIYAHSWHKMPVIKPAELTLIVVCHLLKKGSSLPCLVPFRIDHPVGSLCGEIPNFTQTVKVTYQRKNVFGNQYSRRERRSHHLPFFPPPSVKV